MTRRKGQRLSGIACLLGLMCASAAADPAARLARGELLYNNHCLACHTEQMHWREQRLVTDLESLTAQVQRWQMVTRAGWNADDIAAVTQYLNSVFYQFSPPKRPN